MIETDRQMKVQLAFSLQVTVPRDSIHTLLVYVKF
jgi:hypothetical protein